MIRDGTAIMIARTLAQVVPMLYLLMAMYLGFAGGPRRALNWVYIFLFGGFGIATYMLLNKPTYEWVPVWVTGEVWLTIALLTLLAIGVLLFLAAIEIQELDPPRAYLIRFYRYINQYLR